MTETRSIIDRAVTEAIANIKLAAQRYQTTGRVEDNNNLERLVKGIRKYAYTDNKNGTWTEVVTTIIDGEENETTATVNKAGKEGEETIYETVTLKPGDSELERGCDGCLEEPLPPLHRGLRDEPVPDGSVCG